MTAGSSADSAAGTVPPASNKTSSAERMSPCGDRISRASCKRFVLPCDRQEKSSPQLQEDSEAGLLNRECLGVTPFDDHATPYWAPFMGVIASLNRMLLCGNAAAPHCVGFPTWQDGSALCWVPNTMPNAGGVATNQASADKCAAAAFPATRSCPGWGAPAQTQDRNKTSECERGWCGPPSFISRCVAVPADGI